MSKIAFVTGATDGLGRGVALDLARKGTTVLIHGRNREKANDVAAEIAELGTTNVRIYVADFASLDDVRAMADDFLVREARLDVLINNAGLGVESSRRVSRDGNEMLFQVDYLAGFLLSRKLLPLLHASAPARIVNVASAGQAPINFDDVMLERGWNGVQSYCQAKLAQITMTMDMARELAGSGVTVNALHPASYMPTKIVKGLFAVQSSLEDGIANVVRLALDPSFDTVSGRYFNRNVEARANEQAYEADAQQKLRCLSMRLTRWRRVNETVERNEKGAFVSKPGGRSTQE